MSATLLISQPLHFGDYGLSWIALGISIVLCGYFLLNRS